ncbi:MAG: hypothetical protein V7K21_30430 [Nostoc sp.]|uniref:hypothetical protein n=1 Tax=Nostoc sp. TaxID=1180 RepID=UPI002FF556A7
MFDRLVGFYKRYGWPMEQVPDNTILTIRYSGDIALWDFIASSDEPTQTITMFARVPEVCPPELFKTMSEFLERANFGMTYGAWVMDRRDGEIRYRVGADVGNLAINDEFLESLTLYTNLTMNHYLKAIFAILKEGASAQATFNLVFSDDQN